MSKEAYSTPNWRLDQDVKRDLETAVREGVKAKLEEVLQGEMTEHPQNFTKTALSALKWGQSRRAKDLSTAPPLAGSRVKKPQPPEIWVI